jgi:hypothetical protein
MNAAILILSAVLAGHILASIVWLWYVLHENWQLTMRVAELEGRLYFLETRHDYHEGVINELRRRR